MGLSTSGWKTTLLCENNPAAQAVLRPDAGDRPARRCKKTPRTAEGCYLVAAGFPCQDLSQAGMTRGIGEQLGARRRSIPPDRRKKGPRWLLLENVPFMLQLDRGAAMRLSHENPRRVGYRWAYRVVDARSFGCLNVDTRVSCLLPDRRTLVRSCLSRTLALPKRTRDH